MNGPAGPDPAGDFSAIQLPVILGAMPRTLGALSQSTRVAGQGRSRWAVVLLAALLVFLLGSASRVSAQQSYPPNGLLLYAEASSGGTRAFVHLSTARGSLRTVSVSIGANLVARRLPGGGHPAVGTASFLGDKTYTLRYGAPRAGGGITLLRREGVRITYFPVRRSHTITLSGVKSTQVQLELHGPRGALIAPHRCPGSEDFSATVTRAGAASPASATSSTTC